MNYPNARPELASQVRRVRDYTAQNPELAACHHFCFDFRLGAFERADFVVMGLNPGETDDDRRAAPGPAEESSLIDYREGRDSASRRRWFDTCRRIVGSDSISLTELCFWSSPNIPALEQRIGPLNRSDHMRFCRTLNDDLLAHHRPRAVVLPGLGLRRLVIELYGLKHVHSQAGANGKALVEHYVRDGVPWIFTKHWSGSFGFSNNDKEQIKSYLRSLELHAAVSKADALQDGFAREKVLGPTGESIVKGLRKLFKAGEPRLVAQPGRAVQTRPDKVRERSKRRPR